MLAVLRGAEAEEIYRREGSMLRRLLSVGERVLATVDSFPRHHGWLVAAALLENHPSAKIPPEGMVPIHPGALLLPRRAAGMRIAAAITVLACAAPLQAHDLITAEAAERYLQDADRWLAAPRRADARYRLGAMVDEIRVLL